MSYFDATRAELVTRRSELSRRIENIEADLERHGSPEQHEPAPDDLQAVALHEFMQTLRHELGQIESAIRRIDSREYDCCMQCGCTIRSDRLELLPYAVMCAKCSRNYPREYVQQLRGQHASLRRALASLTGLLSEMVRKCERGEVSAGDRAPTLALLADLGRQIPEHFALEEKGGYLAEALAAAPRYSRKAETLLEQHAGFDREMRLIVEQANAAQNSGPAWRQVHEGFQRLSLELLAHEEAENDILGSAFLDDLGAAD